MPAQQAYDFTVALDLKFLSEGAARMGGASNSPHRVAAGTKGHKQIFIS
jgi:hypothetical protein